MRPVCKVLQRRCRLSGEAVSRLPRATSVHGASASSQPDPALPGPLLIVPRWSLIVRRV